jgi:hypothetical protein
VQIEFLREFLLDEQVVCAESFTQENSSACVFCFFGNGSKNELGERKRGTSTNAAESMIAIKFTVDYKCIARALEKVTLICFNSQMSNRQTRL